MIGTYSLPYLTISFSWNFAILIMMCLEVGLFGFLLIGMRSVSWIFVPFSLIKLGKFSIIIFSNRFSIPCSSFPSSIPIIPILFRFMLSCSSLNTSSFFLSHFAFSFFFFFCSFWVLFFSTLFSSLLIWYYGSSSLLLIPSTVSFNSEIVFSFPLCPCW